VPLRYKRPRKSRLNKRVSELYSAAKFLDAIPLARKSQELARAQRSPDHPDPEARMGWLALLYKSQYHYAVTEPLYKRSLAIRTKALGPDYPGRLPIAQPRRAAIAPKEETPWPSPSYKQRSSVSPRFIGHGVAQ
jgi:hypothetical protein